MTVRLTRKRIDILFRALAYMEAEYEGTDVPPDEFSTWEEWETELEACREWLRQTERKRNK